MKTVSLASGHVSSTDVLSIEEIRPDTHPAKIIIKWPPRPPLSSRATSRSAFP